MTDQDDRLAPGIWKIVCVAAIGSFMAQLDATIVNVSLIGLAARLHAPLGTIQWVMSGYLLALALTLPLNGWLVDRIGARAVYLWCFAGFTISSALCGLAWSAQSLIGFRILQGMSGGLLAPMAQLMVARAAGRHMPQVAAFVTMPVLLAPLLGPVVAGALLEIASWRWLFLVNVPVGAVAFALAAVVLPRDRAETRPRDLDLAGLAMLSPALALFLYGADHIGVRFGQTAILVACGLFTLYIRAARRKGEHALIDISLLKGRVFRTSVSAMFVMNAVSFAGQMVIPAYLMQRCGRSPAEAGALLVPLGLGMMCTYPFMGRLTKRFGIRRLTGYGAALSFVGTLPLVFMAQGTLRVPLLEAGLFLRGIGTSAIGVPAMSAGYASVPKPDLATATTALNIVQRLGGPVGTTLCATILDWRLSVTHGGAHAYVTAFGLLLVLHALLFVVTWRLPRVLPDASART